MGETNKKSFSEKMSYVGECLKNRDFKNPALLPAKVILVSFLCIIVAVILLLLVRVRSIQITGDLSVFSEQEIAEAAGVDFGDGMYTSWGIKRSIRDKLPMVDRIRVSRNPFTGKLSISITLREYEYFIAAEGRFFAVDKHLKVTDVRDSYLSFSALGAVPMTLPEVESPALGQALIFSGTVDVLDENGEVVSEGEPEKKYEYIRQMLEHLSETEYIERTNAVLLDEKFNIRLVIDEKYLVTIGKCESLSTKLEVMDAIIKEGSVSYGTAAHIDVNDPALASARVDNTLDISEYILNAMGQGDHAEDQV